VKTSKTINQPRCKQERVHQKRISVLFGRQRNGEALESFQSRVKAHLTKQDFMQEEK
jgi:hypothetical protein